MRESRSRPGEVLVGTRTIQEGGAFADTTREEVEMFCIDQQASRPLHYLPLPVKCDSGFVMSPYTCSNGTRCVMSCEEMFA